MEFLDLFKDHIFVSISKIGGHILHTKSLEKVLARNTPDIKDGAYFTVNGFANFEEGSQKGRTKANVTTFNCNFLDIDLTPEKRRTQAELVYRGLCDTGLQPTSVVLTGKGLHVYWVYKAPAPFSEYKLREYEILQSAIVEHFKAEGADRQARDAARVLRVPGAAYYDGRGEHSADVELLYFNPGVRYDPSEIAGYFKNSIRIETREGEGLVRGQGDFNLATAYNVKRGARHHMAYSTALSLIQKAKTLSAARELFAAAVNTWEATRGEELADMADYWKQFDNAVKMLESDKPQLFIGDPDASPIKMTAFQDVPDERVEWLWPGILARGKSHILTGPPGLGKSQLTVDIAARLSNGAPFPSYTLGAAGRDPAGVIILSAEDGAADTIKPRLRAAGADLSRVFSLSSTKIVRAADGRLSMSSLALKEDAEHMLKAIATLKVRVGLIVIDPVSAFLSADQDSNSNSDVRGTLAQLQGVLMDKGIALLMVNHTNKNVSAKSAHMRSLGSTAWNAVARTTLYVFEDPDEEGRKVFSVDKVNLAKKEGHGFFYRIRDKEVDVLGEGQSTPYIEWDVSSFPAKDADEYMRGEGRKRATKADECESTLDFYMVGNDAVATKEALAYMKERGFSPMETYRAARKLGIISNEHGVWKRNQ